MIDLAPVQQYLDERRFANLVKTVADLEASIQAGKVRNVLFNEAKFVINRRIDEAVDAFDEAARNVFWSKNPDAPWAPGHDVMVSGAYNLPAALKEMTKKGNADRAALIRSLLPLNDLLKSAKPLIVKRGDEPKAPPVAKEGEMTCQCCGRWIMANNGVIAHHGYERPGTGWQTASCMGARELPFEVSRDRLGDMIVALKGHVKHLNKVIVAIETEKVPARFNYVTYEKTGSDRFASVQFKRYVDVTRDIFEGFKEAYARWYVRWDNFDEMKAHEVALVQAQVEQTKSAIKEAQYRYDHWKQTHKWNKTNKVWDEVKS